MDSGATFSFYFDKNRNPISLQVPTSGNNDDEYWIIGELCADGDSRRSFKTVNELQRRDPRCVCIGTAKTF